MSSITRLALLALAALAGLCAQSTAEAVSVFYMNRTDFMADARVTGTTSVNFDDVAPGTNLTGQTLSGVRFLAPGTPALVVIPDIVGVKFPMRTSTPTHVLSPGGSDRALEDDDLLLVFDTPVQAAGLDVVFDAPVSLVRGWVRFLDVAGATLYNGFILEAFRYQFVGLVADAPVIKSVWLDEFDTGLDINVAYDSVVFSPGLPGPEPVPEPGTAILLGSGLIALALLRSRPGRRWATHSAWLSPALRADQAGGRRGAALRAASRPDPAGARASR